MIAATSWFLITLCGLGLPLAALIGGADARREWCAGKDKVRLAALALMLGLLADHAVGLVSGSLGFQATLAWAGGLAAIGALALLARTERRVALGGSWQTWGALALTAGLTLAIYAAPLMEWDARSIWFFHAKVIFFDGGFKSSGFWSDPAYDWSHTDYPELLPMLAARFGAFAGAWNEYAPKGALVPLATAGFLGLLAAEAAGFLATAAAAVAVLGATLWNGYMDGWIALYAAVAVLAIAAWVETGLRTRLAVGMAALGIALCLKNEGQLLMAAALAPISWALAARRRALQWRDLVVLITFLPFAIWLVVKAKLGVQGDLEGAGIARRALEVLGDPGELLYRLSYLAQSAFRHSHLFGAAGAFLTAGVCVGFRVSPAICGVSAVLYTGGLIVVYLGTPKDFVWHVGTSLDRVLMTPTLLFLSGLSTMMPTIVSACRQPAAPPMR